MPPKAAAGGLFLRRPRAFSALTTMQEAIRGIEMGPDRDAGRPAETTPCKSSFRIVFLAGP